VHPDRGCNYLGLEAESPFIFPLTKPVDALEGNTAKIVRYGSDDSHPERGAGFYELYQINPEHDSDDAEESESAGSGEQKGRTVGLHSPWGTIWSIAETTGWTVNYILWGIAWINIRMMLADAPRYISVKTNQKKEITTAEELEEFWGENNI
jgi:hypothetical protein